MLRTSKSSQKKPQSGYGGSRGSGIEILGLNRSKTVPQNGGPVLGTSLEADDTELSLQVPERIISGRNSAVDNMEDIFSERGRKFRSRSPPWSDDEESLG